MARDLSRIRAKAASKEAYLVSGASRLTLLAEGSGALIPDVLEKRLAAERFVEFNVFFRTYCKERRQSCHSTGVPRYNSSRQRLLMRDQMEAEMEDGLDDR